MKPIWPNDCGAIFGAYFLRIWNISAESGPDLRSRRGENSLLIQRCPSNAGENWPDMNVFAIGVDEPHFTLLTMPCASPAFMKAGAVSGVKSSMMPPSVPGELVHLEQLRRRVGDRQVRREDLDRDALLLAELPTPPSAYAEIVSGDAMAIFLTPAAMSACAAPTLL